MRTSIIVLSLSIFLGCNSPKNVDESQPIIKYDSHVHLMSPKLIKYWKELGIPFSKSESNYSNIDTILHNNKAEYIDLIGMAYVYGNPEYYSGNDEYEKMMSENNYLFETANQYPNRIKPFFAIDPLKEYALKEIERCYRINSQSGLKLHFNASQVYLTESDHLKKIKKVFLKASELRLPILLHFDNWHPKFGKSDIEILADSILNELNPIQLQIAHFGTSGGFTEKTERFIEAYLDLKDTDRIPSKHRILFDISAVALDKDSEGVSKLTKEEFKKLNEYIADIGVQNIVFGTDYPLYKSNEYYKILVEKVGLTKEEMKFITSKKTATNTGG